MDDTTSLISDDSHNPLAKTYTLIKSSTPVFILCDRCYWCATYFSNARIPRDNICPQCNANSNQLTSFPIASDESFTFNYNEKRGLELEFKQR
jgi:hypothetical protein